jgi:hypothetical protein
MTTIDNKKTAVVKGICLQNLYYLQLAGAVSSWLHCMKKFFRGTWPNSEYMVVVSKSLKKN